MAATGSVNNDLDLIEIVEEAWERAVGTELKTGYEFRTARRSLNLLLHEWQNRGLHWWSIPTVTETLSSGSNELVMPAGFIDVLDVSFSRNNGQNNQSDRMLTRVSIDSYDRIVNKRQTGEPLRYFVDRTLSPSIKFWPYANADYTIVYRYLRNLVSVAEGTDTANAPLRYLPALVAGLAFYIAQKVPEAAGRLPNLKAAYDEQFEFAENQEREKASWRIVPRVVR